MSAASEARRLLSEADPDQLRSLESYDWNVSGDTADLLAAAPRLLRALCDEVESLERSYHDMAQEAISARQNRDWARDELDRLKRHLEESATFLFVEIETQRRELEAARKVVELARPLASDCEFVIAEPALRDAIIEYDVVVKLINE